MEMTRQELGRRCRKLGTELLDLSSGGGRDLPAQVVPEGASRH